MKKILATFLFTVIIITSVFSQYKSNLTASEWTDSVFNSLDNDQKIAQLMVIRAHSNLGADHIAKVISEIKKYNVGSLCFFQGGPVRQANLTNYYQSIAKTPLLITIDGEWGLGMRLDSVTKFPYQLTLGAMNNEALVYEMGIAVGEQHKRMGVHVNFAPVVDINNNPNNPVIGYRSFGEDKYKVAKFGVAYMKGMQDAGIMACAKHFPGHGDVDVDSHLDLPVINKTREQLDSMELYPFRELFNAGVGSVMIAHLSIPSIDNTEHVATSISKNNVTNLLRADLKFAGLTFTDALEMKGVAKYFPGGTIAVEAIIAGNDMLCLPEDVGMAISEIKKAINENKLSWNAIYEKVKKVLLAKYQLGLNKTQQISLNNLVEELNAKTDAIKAKVAKETITVLSQGGMSASRTDYAEIPLKQKMKIAYVGIGTSQLNAFGKRMKTDLNADVFLYSWKDGDDKTEEIFEAVEKNKYDAVVVGIHDFSLRPANNYGITRASFALWRKLNFIKTITVVFGNVLAANQYCGAYTLVAAHQDDIIFQETAADLIEGKIGASGKLPVRVCKYPAGYGIDISGPEKKTSIINNRYNLFSVDSIANDAISQKVFPGCVVLAVKDGEIIFHKAYGNFIYNAATPVTLESIYDLASVTKISATTVSVMKLYEQGKINLKKTLGDYLPWVKGTDKENLHIDDILLHQAGLVPFIPFYKETIDTTTGNPNPAIYSPLATSFFKIPVAKNLYLRKDWNDTMFSRILKSPLGVNGRYVYSDNDFIFLGKIVEQVSGMPLNEYVQKNFYSKIAMRTTGFNPRNRFWNEGFLVPTENETHFRQQLIQGYVHDEGASMFGGVAGHAGLFSSAYDLAMLYQMLLNGGEINGTKYLKPETIKLFTAYHATGTSRRGYGFDKPEKDNATRKDPYPSSLVSSEAYGHTGFTGTCVWVDPKVNLVYVFLSNRVYPTRNNPKLLQMNIRGKIQDAIYAALK